MHAIGQATKVESAYYSVESVRSAASYDKGTDEAGASTWGRQAYEQKARRFLWVIGWWEPRARWRAQRGWSGACRREVGGLGEQKGIVCCVDDVHSFSRRKATRGSWMLRHSPLGSAEKAGGLWVLDFFTSLSSRFCFFNHVLSVRIQPVLPPV